MKKRVIAILLTLVLVVSGFAGMTVSLAADGDGYTLITGDTLEITSTLGSYSHRWTSSDTNVATASGNSKTGDIVGVGAGGAVITHTYKTSSYGSDHTETFNVTVKARSADRYELNMEGSIEFTGASGSGTHTWTASPSGMVTITSSGNTATVKGVKEGDVTITHTYGTNGKETFLVHVAPPVEKTVHWTEEGKTAQIIVQSVQNKESSATTPKVLFLGSLCSSHDLGEDYIENAINGLAKVADVDYYLYGLKMSDLSNANGPMEDTVLKGSQMQEDPDDDVASQMHISHFYFAEVLRDADLDDYDLVVLEFDGARMVDMGNYKNSDGLSKSAIITDLKNQYKKSDTISGWSSHHNQSDLEYEDLEEDLAAAAFKLQGAYAENKVAWLVPARKDYSSRDQSNRGGQLIYDDNVFGGNVSGGPADLSSNLTSAAWDGLAIMAPEVWLAKNSDGTFKQEKGTQPTTKEAINAALFSDGSQYKENGEAKFADGEGLWTTYGNADDIAALIKAKSEDLLRYEQVDITDVVAHGFTIKSVEGQYLDEKSADAPKWVTIPQVPNGDFTWNFAADNPQKIEANFKLQNLHADKTRLLINIETTEEVVYEGTEGSRKATTNTGSVTAVYDKDQTTKEEDDPPSLPEPGISVTKTPSKTGTLHPGDKVDYEITIKNIGKVKLTGITLTDALLGIEDTALSAIDSKLSNDLEVGQSVTLKVGPYTVTSADAVSGKVVNRASATGMAGDNPITGKTLAENVASDKADVTVTKVWEDGENQDGIRPGSVTVTLKADGTAVTDGVQELDEDNEWTYTWPNLYIVKDGKTVEYTIEETKTDVIADDDGPGTYDIEVSGNASDGFTVTNTHTPETEEISGSKVWNDSEYVGKTGYTRPSVTINIWGKTEDETDPTSAGSVSVTSEDVDPSDSNKWNWKVEDLPSYRNGKKITYTVTEEQADGYKAAEVTDFEVKNTPVDKTTAFEPTSITVKKVDSQTETGKGLQGAIFKLEKKGTPDNTVVKDDITTGTDGTATVEFSSDGEYILTETAAPEGYKLGNPPASYTIKVEEGEVQSVSLNEGKTLWTWLYSLIVSNDELKDGVLTVANDPLTQDITLEKAWADNGNQDGKRFPVTFDLYKTIGGATTKAQENITLSADADTDKDTKDSWTVKITGLPTYEDGQNVTYSVAETTDLTDTGYTKTENGLKVTNTHTPETVTASVTKTWDDANDRDKLRPEKITVTLTGKIEGETDPVYTNTKDVSAASDGTWTYEWKDLAKYNKGKEITYSVSEATVEGYEDPEYSGSGYAFGIENTHTPETTSVKVTKEWNDNNDQDGKRPETVEVTLLANGEPVEQDGITAKQTLSEDGNNWTYTWEGLFKNENGSAIVYTVEETKKGVITGTDAAGTYGVEVKGSAAAGYTVVNTHTPEKRTISGTKTWDDDNNRDGKRPQSIDVTLTGKNGNNTVYSDTKNVKANDDGTWTYEWTVDRYNAGTEITYTVSEGTIESYEPSFDGYNIKNTHEIEKTSVKVTKEWNDNDNQDGFRPAEVTVVLAADGKDVEQEGIEAEVKLNAGNNWTYTWEGLNKKNAGTDIVYTVTEIAEGAITGEDGPGTYRFEVSGDASSGFTIRNIHTPEKTKVEGSKTWDDAGDQDGKRPGSIHISLYDGGTDPVDEKDITANDGWAWSFTGIPRYRAGNEIEYSIVETAIEGYSVTPDGFNVTNNYTPEKTSVSVTKTWDDDGDRDGLRPDSVDIQLYADDVAVDGKLLTLSKDNNWQGSFTELNVCRDHGTKIVYTVKEEETDDLKASYATQIDGNASDGFIVKNTHEIAETEVSVGKIWDDADDQDGKRPESVEFILYADDEPVDNLVLTDEDDWEGSFTELPVYRDHGTPIVYTVDEKKDDSVITGEDGPGTYAIDVAGDADGGFAVTNTHTPETKPVSGNVEWDDDDDNDGKRPDEVTVHIIGTIDGEPISDTPVTVTPDPDGNWEYSKDDLPKYSEGKEIVYIVSEDPIPEYSTDIDGTDITNKHVPEKTDITVTKIWDDGDNKDKKRPESIKVTLTGKCGEETVLTNTAEIKETADGGWQYKFTDLPVYKNKVKVKYEVAEEKTEFYESDVNGFYITNTHVLDVYDMVVEKTIKGKPEDDKGYAEGETITYVIKVSNKGNIPVGVIEIEDSLTGDKWTLESLEPGASKEYEVTYKVTVDDAKAGTVKNVAKVTYPEGPDGKKVTKTAEAEAKTTAVKEPDTGDHSNTILWAIMMLLAAVVMLNGGILIKRRNGR